MPHNESWRRSEAALKLSLGISCCPPGAGTQDLLWKRPLHCSDPQLPLWCKKLEWGEVVFPTDAVSLAQTVT